VIQNSLNDKI
nr:neurotoxin type A Hn+ 35 kda subunit [Clostridium botulinum, type A, Peptide Partial, 10 aa] [Clostridium botulinum]